MMTREDMLRELELLPVWQLRAPAAISASMPETAQTPAQPEVSTKPPANSPVLRLILSEDSHFLFVLEALKTNEEETLLQNILKAMQAKSRMDIGLQRISDLSTYSAKIMIVMGESAAQTIGLQANKHEASSVVVQTEFGAAIVTFSPAHLLANGSDKALAWQDLCLAKAHIKSL